jgi:hypothetical protein
MRRLKQSSLIVMGVVCLGVAILNFGGVHWSSTASCLIVATLAIPAAFLVKD